MGWVLTGEDKGLEGKKSLGLESSDITFLVLWTQMSRICEQIYCNESCYTHTASPALLQPILYTKLSSEHKTKTVDRYCRERGVLRKIDHRLIRTFVVEAGKPKLKIQFTVSLRMQVEIKSHRICP